MSSISSENIQSSSPMLNAFNQLIDFLSSELKINNEKISALRSRIEENLKSLPTSKPEKKPTVRKSKKADSDAKQCQYEFGKRSKNPGEKCGGKVCEESTSGLYCKKHIKQEKSAEKETVSSSTEKKEKVAPKNAKSKNESKEITSTAVQALQDSAPVFTVKKNKWGNYAHEGTGFLFERNNHKVYGRQKSDGSIAQLTLEDIETCKSMGFEFIIPPNLTSKNDKQADDDEELEEEEEEEEDEEDLE